MTGKPARARVALDLMGGDHAPDAIVDGALLAIDEHDDLEVVLVGPEEVAVEALAARAATGRFRIVHAGQVVGMDEDPVRAVRAKRDATIRVATRLVRDGDADAVVSAGHTGAAIAAALFTLGRLPGVTRAAVAVVVPALDNPVVLLDAGANPDCGPDLLAQFALAGAAFATARFGIAGPRVALLTNGEEWGKGDEVRRSAYDVLAALPIRFVGPVEAAAVVSGGVDVVVTDGFTGNVLLKGVEAAVRMHATLVREALGATADEALAAVAARLDPDGRGGGVLLGVDGVVVVAHGQSSPRAIASAISTAALAARNGLVPAVGTALAGLVAQRRADAGLDLPVVTP